MDHNDEHTTDEHTTDAATLDADSIDAGRSSTRAGGLHPPRLALVGDRRSTEESHNRIPRILDALASGSDEALDAYWLRTDGFDPTELAGFDGVYVVPGSPYADSENVLEAVRVAREAQIPFLGTCGGFQHLLMELARDVCGIADVSHAETSPDAPAPLIVPLACSLFGEEDAVTVEAGTIAGEVMGAGPTTERFFCRYNLDRNRLPLLEQHGLVASGHDAAGDIRIAELDRSLHPWCVGTLFQPELASDPGWIHPILRAFVAAVRRRAAGDPVGATASATLATTTLAPATVVAGA